MRNVHRTIFTTVITASMLFAGTVSAQSTSSPSTAHPTADLTKGGLVDCFDYYTFGSVQAHLTPSVTGTVSGTPISFKGVVTNANRYPVVGGTLYIKVFKQRKDAATKNANGPFVVDQFIAKDNITIPAGGSVPVSFSWNVPSYAESGEYEVATFFTTSHKYNLLGLSFTDDVIGNKVSFRVTGEQKTGVSFDKDTVTVSGAPYHFAAFPPHVVGTPDVTASVVNTTAKDITVPVTWRLYAWDAQQNTNLITSQNENVTVKARSKASITFRVKDTSNPVYLVEGTVQYQDTKSIINVRMVRDNLDRLRINFPSVTAFPLVAGQSNTVFSCMHNMATGTPDGRLELELYDENHTLITGYTYTGAISGDMQAVAKQFTPNRNYNHVTLEARLYQGQVEVANDVIDYDCMAIDPALCIVDSNKISGIIGFLGTLPLLPMLAGIIVFVVGTIAFFVIKRRSHTATS